MTHANKLTKKLSIASGVEESTIQRRVKEILLKVEL